MGTGSVKRRLENRPLRLGGPEDEREAEPLPADPGNTQQLARAGRRLGFLSRWDPRKGAGVPPLSPVFGWPGAVSLLAPVGSSEGEPGAGEGGHVSTPGDAGPMPPASGPGNLARLLPARLFLGELQLSPSDLTGPQHPHPPLQEGQGRVAPTRCWAGLLAFHPSALGPPSRSVHTR